MEIKPFDVVAILEDQPTKGLVRGQVGTVVETLAPGVFEVEFSDKSYRTMALIASAGIVLIVLFMRRANCCTKWRTNCQHRDKRKPISLA